MRRMVMKSLVLGVFGLLSVAGTNAFSTTHGLRASTYRIEMSGNGLRTMSTTVYAPLGRESPFSDKARYSYISGLSQVGYENAEDTVRHLTTGLVGMVRRSSSNPDLLTLHVNATLATIFHHGCPRSANMMCLQLPTLKTARFLESVDLRQGRTLHFREPHGRGGILLSITRE